jgi:23S rRNA pseudouridine2605 synthase
VVEVSNKSSLLEVVLYQGLNRQIRKMFDFLGFEVQVLKRIQHATITLDGLKKGEIKPIKPKQIKELKAYLSKIARKNA